MVGLAPEGLADVFLDTNDWQPVTYQDGHTDKVGFRRMLTDAHHIVSVETTSPPGQAALLRILTALVYQALDLNTKRRTVDQWRRIIGDLLGAGQFPPTEIDEYFDRWHARFGVFDPYRPWRQDPRLRAETDGPTGLTRLITGRPAGNNATLFSPFHGGAPGVAAVHEAVESMLVVQFYGPLGRCQSRQPAGAPRSKADFTYPGPLRSRVSYHPLGRTLFETLIAHLVNPASLDLSSSERPDLPEWEREHLPDPVGVKPYPSGIVSLLADDSGHAVLLQPGLAQNGEAVVTNAWLTWKYSDKTAKNLVGQDPYLSYKADEGNIVTQQADAARVVWRDLPALLNNPLQAARSEPYRQPNVLATLPTYVEPLLPVFASRRLRVCPTCHQAE